MEISLDLSVLSVISGRMGRGGGSDAVIRMVKLDGDPYVHIHAKGSVMFCAASVPTGTSNGEFDTYVRLADLVEISGRGQVTLRVLGDAGVEKVDGRTKTRIRACSSEDFPGIPAFGFKDTPVQATDVMDLVATVVKAGCYDPDVPSKAGVMVEPDGDTLVAIGADGKRFNVAHRRGASFEFGKVFIPHLLAETYVSVKKADKGRWDAVDVTVEGDDVRGHVALLFKHQSGASFAVACPRVESSFPSYQRLLSTPVAGEVCFSTDELLAAVTEAASNRWAAGKAVKLAPGQDCVLISLNTNDVDIETSCAVAGSLPDMAAADWPMFTADHLLATMKSFSDLGVTGVRVRFAKNRYPAVFEGVEDTDAGFKAILLPRTA